MGYSEMYCTTCGVSFNIARIRCQDEPKSAAWDDGNTPNSCIEAHSLDTCGKDSGCTYYSRRLDDGIYRSPWHETEDADDRCEKNDGMGCLATGFNGEHIAGPGCDSIIGYTGNNISVEEMLNLLDPKRINWYKLYYSLRRGFRNGELKGLANRKRIWNGCQSILE
ncbi:hypothetical protein BST61_g2576 [Cercospora zeina]